MDSPSNKSTLSVGQMRSVSVQTDPLPAEASCVNCEHSRQCINLVSAHVTPAMGVHVACRMSTCRLFLVLSVVGSDDDLSRQLVVLCFYIRHKMDSLYFFVAHCFVWCNAVHSAISTPFSCREKIAVLLRQNCLGCEVMHLQWTSICLFPVFL